MPSARNLKTPNPLNADMDPKELLEHMQRNRLLAALLEHDREQLIRGMELISLAPRQHLYRAGEQIQFIYFPTSGVVSLVHQMVNGATAEVAVIGCEGLVGLNLLLGATTPADSAIVQVAGEGLRMTGAILVARCERVGRVRQVVLRYAESLLRHISRTAACNRLHSVEQRLCKWLLMCLDRTGSTILIMTQEHIATLLGDRRETITAAEQVLQNAGILSYSRGHLSVLDRAGLEARTCECYAAMPW